jgi:hypothetical protein
MSVDKDEKKEHVANLRVVLDAALATGIDLGDLPPLLTGIAGILLGERIAKDKRSLSDLDMGLSLISMAMRVTARMAMRHGSREGVLDELSGSANR